MEMWPSHSMHHWFQSCEKRNLWRSCFPYANCFIQNHDGFYFILFLFYSSWIELSWVDFITIINIISFHSLVWNIINISLYTNHTTYTHIIIIITHPSITSTRTSIIFITSTHQSHTHSYIHHIHTPSHAVRRVCAVPHAPARARACVPRDGRRRQTARFTPNPVGSKIE